MAVRMIIQDFWRKNIHGSDILHGILFKKGPGHSKYWINIISLLVIISIIKITCCIIFFFTLTLYFSVSARGIALEFINFFPSSGTATRAFYLRKWYKITQNEWMDLKLNFLTAVLNNSYTINQTYIEVTMCLDICKYPRKLL